MRFKKYLFAYCLYMLNTHTSHIPLKEPSIILESRDEHNPHRFNVVESIVFQSPTLKKSILQAQKNGEKMRRIKFDDISAADLRFIIYSMQIIRDIQSKDQYNTQTTALEQLDKLIPLPKQLSIERLKELLTHATHLQIHYLQNFLARALAKAFFIEDTPQKFFTDIAPELLGEIARQYYLVYGEHLEGITLPFGFSIRELLDHKRLAYVSDYQEYDLSGLNINNLDGLQDIPNIVKVKSLNLSHNQITSLKPNDFIWLKQLKKLDLSSNYIASISEPLFMGLISLETLLLANNAISSYSFAQCKDLVSLKELDLQDNLIATLSIRGFSPLKQLEKLYLSYNKIETINSKAFEGLNSLKNLDLHGNHITHFPTVAFQGLKKLAQLDLSNNLIENSELLIHVAKNLERLELLRLSFNKLTAIPNEAINSLKYLRRLSLSGNPFSQQAIATLENQCHSIKISF